MVAVRDLWTARMLSGELRNCSLVYLEEYTWVGVWEWSEECSPQPRSNYLGLVRSPDSTNSVWEAGMQRGGLLQRIQSALHSSIDRGVLSVAWVYHIGHVSGMTDRQRGGLETGVGVE